MLVEVLYCKNPIFGYKKISAIKEIGWEWGTAERFSKDFGIIELDLTKEQINEWSNQNKWCINDKETGLIETAIEFQIKPKEIKMPDGIKEV